MLTWVPLSVSVSDSTVGTGAVGGEYMLCGGTLPQIPLTVLTCHSLCFRQHCGHWGRWWRVYAVWWNHTTNTPRCSDLSLTLCVSDSTVGTGAVGGEHRLCGGTLPQIPHAARSPTQLPQDGTRANHSSRGEGRLLTDGMMFLKAFLEN